MLALRQETEFPRHASRAKTDRWAVVLAGGEGKRLSGLTTTASGEVIPKQYCSLHAPECLLDLALARACGLAGPQRTCAVVASQHRRWWTLPLQRMPSANLFVQPENRGTAVGTLLALLHIERRNPAACVTLLPSDHFLHDESRLAKSLQLASKYAIANPDLACLLGTEPEGKSADIEMGYIVPVNASVEGPTGVKEFVEKPDAVQARGLIEKGALWNMFIVTGSVRTLISLYHFAFRSLVYEMRLATGGVLSRYRSSFALKRLYAELPTVDFSRDVLTEHTGLLQVLRVPPCGWTDLGSPARVAAAIRVAAASQGAGRSNIRPQGGRAIYFDLARAVRRT